MLEQSFLGYPPSFLDFFNSISESDGQEERKETRKVAEEVNLFCSCAAVLVYLASEFLDRLYLYVIDFVTFMDISSHFGYRNVILRYFKTFSKAQFI